MHNKYAVVALLPLLAFLLVPAVTVRATSNNVEFYIWCDSGPQASGASLSIPGHSVILMCPPGVEKDASIYFYVPTTAKATAAAYAGGIRLLQHPVVSGCQGFYGMDVYGPESSAGWEVEAPCFPG